MLTGPGLLTRAVVANAAVITLLDTSAAFARAQNDAAGMVARLQQANPKFPAEA